MAGDHNTAKQAATVDKLIQGLGPLASPTSVSSPASLTSIGSAMRRRRLRPIAKPTGPWMVRGFVALGVALGGVLPQWPYGNACGAGLFFYSSCVFLVIVMGVWGLMFTWNNRLGVSHIVALGTLLWGLALTALIVLPRIGYAATQATWRCVQ